MPVKVELLNKILSNYLKDVDGVIAVAITDKDGFIIASCSKEDSDSDSVLGVISVILDAYIDRIKKEFETSSEDIFNITMTGDKKFASKISTNSILTTIAEPLTSNIALRVYSEHVAGKIELLLEGSQNISIKIPEIIKFLSKTKTGRIPKGDFIHKIILTGDYRVGKSALVDRFVNNKFQETYISTVGIEISKKTLQLSEDTLLNFLIWDIADQRSSFSYNPNFYNEADAAFIVIDRTRPEILKSIKNWYMDIKNTIKKHIPIILVGNKSDLVEKIVVSGKDIEAAAEQYGFHHILTSAMTGENVEDAFRFLAYKILER